MQYKSPIPLILHTGVNMKNIHVASLNKIQKNLLIELELSEEKSLRIDGQDLTKDDIISIFDDLKDGKIMQFHQWIYDNPYLRKFIQYGEISNNDGFFDLSLSYHYNFRDFKTFVSPYLAPPLAKAVNRAFLKRQFGEAQQLMVCHHLIADAHFDEAFGRLRSSIKELAGEIRQAEQNIKTFQRSQFTYISRAFIDFLNALPEQFTRDREEIVNGLINLSVKLPFHHLEFCRNLYRTLQYVKCDVEIQKLIFHNLNVFSHKGEKKKYNVSIQLYIGVGIFLLALLFRACAS
jgi:hypothetical protein